MTARLAALACLVACTTTSIPAAVLAEQARTPKELVVVEYIDFECPFCRRLNQALAPLVAARAPRVRVVRKHVPLTDKHPYALDAARASVCADALGNGDEMADALFDASDAPLTAEGTTTIATRLGIDAGAFRACIADPRATARIQRDTAEFDAMHGEGLPTVFIGRTAIVGAEDSDVLARTLDEELARLARR
jgi:predicted DsbA family dithiol-disulfide isomerase